jgi:hypothetical protein
MDTTAREPLPPTGIHMRRAEDLEALRTDRRESDDRWLDRAAGFVAGVAWMLLVLYVADRIVG